MATDGPIPMTTEALSPNDLLTLAQWLSPSFPVGAFSYSHGLEWSVDTGEVTNANSFATWLATVIEQGAGRTDLILLAAAYRAGSRGELAEVDALARALACSAERLLETEQQGAAFAHTASAIWRLNLPELAFPVAVGAAASSQGVPLDPTARMYLQAFASNLVSAAIRLIPLGQTEGQACLGGLATLINRTADIALGQSLDGLGSSAFLVDIASMCHETQNSRIFRS